MADRPAKWTIGIGVMPACAGFSCAPWPIGMSIGGLAGCPELSSGNELASGTIVATGRSLAPGCERPWPVGCAVDSSSIVIVGRLGGPVSANEDMTPVARIVSRGLNRGQSSEMLMR
jgi:hypothetical protein